MVLDLFQEPGSFGLNNKAAARRELVDAGSLLRDRSVGVEKLAVSAFRPPPEGKPHGGEPSYHPDEAAEDEEAGGKDEPKRIAYEDHNHDRSYVPLEMLRTVAGDDADYFDPISDLGDAVFLPQAGTVNYNLRVVTWDLDTTRGITAGPVLVIAEYSTDAGVTWSQPRVVGRLRPSSTQLVYRADSWLDFNPALATPAQARYSVFLRGHDNRGEYKVPMTGPDGTIDNNFLGSGAAGWYYGPGSPEGVVTAAVGKGYRDTTNGTLYVKRTGSGNTGWLIMATRADVTADIATHAAASDPHGDRAFATAADLALFFKAPVRAATTSNGTLATAFENGDTIDGIVLATGDRILLRNQSSGAENGIYVVQASGAPVRAADFDSTAEVYTGVAVLVTAGTTNARTVYYLSTTGVITVGTTALTFSSAYPTASTTVQGILSLLTNLETSSSKALTGNDDRLKYARQEVALATDAAPAAYSRSSSVITFSAVGSQSVDGVSTALNDRILLKNGAAGADNGIWRVSTKGTGAVAEVWTRASDMDESAECSAGMLVAVFAGTVNAGTIWRLDAAPGTSYTINTTTLTWVRAEKIDAASSVASLRTLGTGSSQAAAGNDSRLLAEVRVRRPFQLTAGGTKLAITGTAYAIYLGQTREAVTWKYVEAQVNTAGTGAQTAEVGLFSSPLPPNKAGQTLTKLWADGTVDSLVAAGPVVVRNTGASATQVAAGVHLWAVIRTAMATTQPTFLGVGSDMSQGGYLEAVGCAALTGLSTQAFTVVAIAASSAAVPMLAAVQD